MPYTPQVLTGRKNYTNTNIAFNQKTQTKEHLLDVFRQDPSPMGLRRA